MVLKILITFLLYIPLTPALATQTDDLTAQKINNSTHYYNSALKHLQESNLGKAKAFIERSLFLNPLSPSAYKLNTKITEEITESLGTSRKEEVSFSSHLLGVIPSLFSYIFLICALILFFLSLARLTFSEKSSYKTNPKLRLKTTATAFLLFLSVLLYTAKEASLATKWACITSSSSSLFTGPHENSFVQTTSLPQGSCIEVVSTMPNWVSLKPAHHPAGWANRNDLMIVRGYKFDPSINKD
ncbi:MAG: hypothetical protein ACRBBP_07715 [Bdellovibrionales bacterium]